MSRPFASAPSRRLRRRAASPVAAWLAASTLLFGQSVTTVHADQTISSAVTGPVYGDNAAITITATGSVTNGGGSAILTSSTNTVTTLTTAGAISASDYGINNVANTIGTITNSGTITGGDRGVENAGTITTFINAGAVQGGNYGVVYNGDGNSLVNQASGSITATNNEAVYVATGKTLTSLTNAGSITGNGYGAVYTTGGTIGTLTNEATGTISSTSYFGLLVDNGSAVGTISNAGTISGAYEGIYNYQSSITSLTNSGTLTGPLAGGIVNYAGSIGSVTNTGTIDNILNDYTGVIGTGTGSAIESTGAGATIGELTNYGTINGGVTIANQNLLVHGDTSPSFGVFEKGTITVQNGSLTFVDGSTYLDSDVVVSSAGGTAGQGTMTNQGELILGATRQLDGSFVQTAAGLYTTALFGATEYGKLVATGSATFDGALNLEEQGLALAGGETLDLFTFASAVGDFSSLAVNGTVLSSLGGGAWAYGSLILTEVWTATTMSLSVTSAVPEIDPAGLGSVLSLLLGSLALAERRRRGTA